MLRYVYVGVFLVGLACAVACGRQVTPNPTLSGLSGEILLKFRTIGTPNFLLYNYILAVNTTGNSQEPYAIGFQNGQFQNFSYAVVTGALTQNAVLPVLIQYYLIPGAQVPGFRILNFNPATTQLNLNTSSTTSYNEFQIVFQRAQLALAPPTATTPPSPTPTPKPTKSTPTPTPSPTPSPGSGSGSGSQPTPVSSPTTSAQSTWCINLFITGSSQGGAAQVYDALGLGATDHSFSSGCFNVNDYQDKVYNQPLPEANPPVDPASALYGFELVNFP
jgi:hypothetical protein